MKNNQVIRVAVDMMSGDFGLDVTIDAVLNSLKINKQLQLILVGENAKITQALELRNSMIKNIADFTQRVSIVNSTEIVTMEDSPAVALRHKKNSSMRVALNLVKAKSAQACVSAGNTGALMVIARYVLKTLPGIDRPAILYPLPSKEKVVNVLDLGANLECSAPQLLQFAVMGSILISATENKAAPTIGLLNVGTEQIKGTAIIKHAHQLINEFKDLNYVGYVEGDDIYKGTVDLVVCDGFVGNVTLKVSEGLAKLITYYLKKVFAKNWYAKLVAFLAKPVLQGLFNQINPNKYNGASFLGLNGTVIKSHGGADPEAFSSAINAAFIAAQKNVPLLIKEKIASQLV